MYSTVGDSYVRFAGYHLWILLYNYISAMVTRQVSDRLFCHHLHTEIGIADGLRFVPQARAMFICHQRR